jgi:hypothetical protein
VRLPGVYRGVAGKGEAFPRRRAKEEIRASGLVGSGSREAEKPRSREAERLEGRLRRGRGAVRGSGGMRRGGAVGERTRTLSLLRLPAAEDPWRYGDGDAVLQG